MPFTEPLADYLDTADFASSAVFSRTGSTVAVIFDAEYRDPLGQQSAGPEAQGRESDFPGAVRGDTLTINSVVYSVTTIEPDGTGMLVLKLREAA